MEIVTLAPDLELFVGDAYRSSATAVRDGNRVLLIDGLGSRRDAEQLRRTIENRGHRVHFLVSTHYFSDHMSAFALFPEAPLLAHQEATRTFRAEEFRTPEEAEHYVEPTILISHAVTIRWGGRTLEVFPNPGHTPGT